MFERYTEKARRVIFYSRYEASQVGSPYIETEHLLLGLFREAPGLFDTYLDRNRRDELVERTRQFSERLKRQQVSTSVDLPLSNESKRVLAYAAEEAEALAHRHIGAEHLLLGLMREESSSAASLLKEFDLKIATLRENIRQDQHQGPHSRSELRISPPRADGCIEFVDEEGQRVGISGLAKAIPRIGEFVCLRRDDVEITYRVARVTYEYYPEPPDSPHAADLLHSIRITLLPSDNRYLGSVPIDST